MEPVNILFYAPLEIFHRPTGPGIYTSQLLKTLLKIDDQNRYIVWHGCMVKMPPYLRPFQPPSDLSDRVQVHLTRFPTRLFHHPKMRSFLLKFAFLPLADWLFNNPQVYFSPFYPFLPHRRGALVLTIFDLTPLTLPHFHLPTSVRVSLLTLLWAKRAKHLLTFSEAVKRQLVEWLGFNSQCITVTPLAADKRFYPQLPESIASIRSKYGLSKPYILFVGTIEPRKNVITLLHAFAKIRKDFPHLLVLVGARGWYSEPVFAEIESLGLQNRVIHTEYVPADDLPPLMSGAEVFVYPSLAEGFGLPPLEAMACGTPVICSNSPALPEVVGDAAITFPPTSVEALSDALNFILKNEDVRKTLRQKGFERVKQFSWERTARLTLNAFEQAAKGE
ncbi:MAG: glycosyltransferase family 4 protein [Armatimonadetes bacterium]|nr:glycosyltransferase family 4 protein [Armatimonadota bacterium]